MLAASIAPVTAWRYEGGLIGSHMLRLMSMPTEDLLALWMEEALRRLEEVQQSRVTTIPADMAIEQVRRDVAHEE